MRVSVNADMMVNLGAPDSLKIGCGAKSVELFRTGIYGFWFVFG